MGGKRWWHRSRERKRVREIGLHDKRGLPETMELATAKALGRRATRAGPWRQTGGEWKSSAVVHEDGAMGRGRVPLEVHQG